MPNYHLDKIDGSPRWYIIWSEGRRTFRKSTWTTDHGEATKRLAAFILEGERLDQHEPGDVAITEVLDTYYEDRASKLPSAEQARIANKRLKAFYGSGTVLDITPGSHARYEKLRRGEGVGFATINRERMVLRAALNNHRKHHGLLNAPFVPSIPENHPDNKAVEPKGRPISLAELRTLIKACSYIHEWRLLMFLIGTMSRPDAAFAFEVDKQADFEHGLVVLNPPGRRQTKKYRPTLPMPRFLREEFRRVKTGPLVYYHGKAIRSAKTSIRRMRRENGLGERVTLYSIRHTMARELRRRGIPSDQIDIMLGHKVPGPRTSEIYAPYAPGYCQQAKRAIEAIWEKVARNLRAPQEVGKKTGRDKPK